MFVSTFCVGKLTTPGWKIPSLNAFIESLTSEHDKLVQMGIIISSCDQALHVSGPKDMKSKGKQQKNPKTKFDAPNPRVENQQHDESSGSRKNKGKGHHSKEKVMCSYCGKGFHHEHAYMKRRLMKLPLSLREITSIFRKDFGGEINKIENHSMKKVIPSWQALRSPKHS